MFDSISYLDPLAQFAIFSAIKIVVVFAVVMTMVAYAVLVERKVSAWIQDRVGPNRAAPFFVDFIPVLGPFLVRAGIFQPMADGLKFILKEDFTPNYVRKVYFWLAPAIAVIPALLTIAVIPFGSSLGDQKMVIADLNVGILYTFGIVSLGVYGIVLAGYASNSKYPFLGGIRSSAQMISYEIAMGMSVIVVFLIVGDLNLGKVVEYQRDHGWLAFPFFAKHFDWQSVIYWPFSLVAFVVFMISAFAETNRLPFDLPESETELVGGYHTEYSSMKFALFFLGEYANMIASSAMMVTLFWGGWGLPCWLENLTGVWSHHPFLLGVLHLLCFGIKLCAFMVVIIWVRWMLPRFRYDQLMDLGWRRFIPLALGNIVATALLMALVTR
jgi:NADH-quinone oxidoreductase subunit H